MVRRDALQIVETTRCSLKIVFFPQNFVIFLNSANSAAALVFYLPGVCAQRRLEGGGQCTPRPPPWRIQGGATPPLRFQREKMFRIGEKCSKFRQKCM